MAGETMTFFNAALLLVGQLPEHLAQMLSQISVKHLPATFGIKTMWYLHSHFEWLKLSYSSIWILLDVCLAAHLEEFLDGLQEMSNCCCLPGKAGGTPGILGPVPTTGAVAPGANFFEFQE